MKFYVVYTTECIPTPHEQLSEEIVAAWGAEAAEEVKSGSAEFVVLRRTTVHALYACLGTAYDRALELADRDLTFEAPDGSKETVNPGRDEVRDAKSEGDVSVTRYSIDEVLVAIEKDAATGGKRRIHAVAQVGYHVGNFDVGLATGVQEAEVEDATGGEPILVCVDMQKTGMFAGVFNYENMRRAWMELLRLYIKSIRPVKTTIFSMSAFREAFATIQQTGQLEVHYQAPDGEQNVSQLWIFNPEDDSHPMTYGSIQV